MSTRPAGLPVAARLIKPLLLALVATALLSGVAGGLLRAGVEGSAIEGQPWLVPALLSHAALMIGGFFGTVIGIERAVAVRLPLAFAAPLSSGAGAVCLLAGQPRAGHALLLLAALVSVAVNVVIVRRQRAAHTWLLLVAAFTWLVGNGLAMLGDRGASTLSWWFAFLVLTIAAERLEMTRLMQRRPGATLAFHAIVVLLLIGAAATGVSAMAGGVLYGGALALLALWLMVHDIARRTVRATGLSRYMAVCLLGGYGWLLVAGIAWAAMALGQPTRDAALHALGLGFVFSMVMGHAPVILPAVAGVKLLFGWPFYLPMALLHVTLLLRMVGEPLRAAGAAGNALAMGCFALTALGAIIAWRRRYEGRRQQPGQPGAH